MEWNFIFSGNQKKAKKQKHETKNNNNTKQNKTNKKKKNAIAPCFAILVSRLPKWGSMKTLSDDFAMDRFHDLAFWQQESWIQWMSAILPINNGISYNGGKCQKHITII